MTKRLNPYAYNITVREFVFEGEPLFEARVKELPDVREYAESAQDEVATVSWTVRGVL